MELKIYENMINIKGNIKSLKDTQDIISALNTLKGFDSIQLIIEDSISITSSLLGELIKLSEEKSISLKVKNNLLYEILEDLDLIEKLNVIKV